MVKIEVSGNTPLEVLSSLTAFATHCMNDKQVRDAANHILEAEKHKEQQEAPATAAPQTDPTGPAAGENGRRAAPTESTAALEKPKGAPPPAGRIPTAEEIRAKGIEAARKYGNPAVKAILQEFNVPNMTSLAESDRAAFLEKLERLGEGNA